MPKMPLGEILEKFDAKRKEEQRLLEKTDLLAIEFLTKLASIQKVLEEHDDPELGKRIGFELEDSWHREKEREIWSRQLLVGKRVIDFVYFRRIGYYGPRVRPNRCARLVGYEYDRYAPEPRRAFPTLVVNFFEDSWSACIDPVAGIVSIPRRTPLKLEELISKYIQTILLENIPRWGNPAKMRWRLVERLKRELEQGTSLYGSTRVGFRAEKERSPKSRGS